LQIPLIGAYAEIHYTLKGLKAAYYNNAPEIIIDLPKRCILKRCNTIPIALIVKDAHLFPTLINNISLKIKCSEKTEKINLPFTEQIKIPFYSHIFEIPIKEEYYNKTLQLWVNFTYTNKNNKKIKAINDNYKAIDKHSFSCYIATDDLPFPDDFKKGEPHYHSNYTADQVEFGAPLEIAQRFAYCMGMDWFFVTDHSYDLDDSPENYLVNDPHTPKWYQQEKEIRSLDRDELRVVQGEEISIGNKNKQNVHLLAINYSFLPGKGDSAEKWFRNKPDLQLSDIQQKDDSLLIAAHPFDEVPFLQKISLNRGYWHLEDFVDNDIDLIQAINCNSLPKVYYAINRWKNYLLKGSKLYLLAGNDAHGNFQFMKQIKTPFLKLFISKKQIFASFFTACKTKANDPISGIKSKYILVSNGPFLDFQLKTERLYHIGDTVNEKSAQLIFQCNSSLEFGEIIITKLFIGDLDKQIEICYVKNINKMSISLPKRGYIRMECLTEKMFIAISNPIWVEQHEDTMYD